MGREEARRAAARWLNCLQPSRNRSCGRFRIVSRGAHKWQSGMDNSFEFMLVAPVVVDSEGKQYVSRILFAPKRPFQSPCL